MMSLSPPERTPTSAQAPAIHRQRHWRPSLVWLLPFIAATIGLSLLIRTLAQHGPEITVHFRSADGLVPGKTPVRYKAVNIGLVSAVRLANDRSQVLATIALSNDAKGFLTRDTRFWVVRPHFASSGISGLETLLSGAYIGVDAGKSTQTSHVFTGLEAPPAVTTDATGKQFVLKAQDLGSLDIGAPVYYRRVQVGQVAAYQLSPDGKDLSLRIFINHPYDALVTPDTRFWHASGLDLQLNAEGIKLSTQALATVLLGGVSFQTPDNSEQAAPAAENTSFNLAADQTEAMKSTDELSPALAILNFDQSVRGLKPGAPVDFRGIEVGQVRSIGVTYQRDKKLFRFPVVVEIYPSRIGLSPADLANQRNARDIAETMSRRGMRAQLRTGNLLTGQLYVAFDFFPGAPPAHINMDGPLPELATTPGTLDEIQTKLGSIVNKIDQIPFADIGQQLQLSLTSLNRMLIKDDQLTAQLDTTLLPQVGATLDEARQTIRNANDSFAAGAPLQQDTRRLLQELTRAAASLHALTDYLERHPESLLRGKPNEEQP